MLFVVLKSVFNTFALVLLKLSVLVVSGAQKLPTELWTSCFVLFHSFVLLFHSKWNVFLAGLCSSVRIIL